MESADQLSGDVGISQACCALGIARASFYRQRGPGPTTHCSARGSPRALSRPERDNVRDTLYSERFMDKSPRQVYARLLDDGQYLCSVRTMYRILEENQACKERQIGRAHV